MLLKCYIGEDSREFLGLQGDQTSQSWRKSVLGIHWKDWCWSWNSNTLATWCEELTLWKGPWCWERLKAGGEGDNRGSDGWMASLTWWTWVWASSGSWWWTGSLVCCSPWGHKESDTTEQLNGTELNWLDALSFTFIRLTCNPKWGSTRKLLCLQSERSPFSSACKIWPLCPVLG